VDAVAESKEREFFAVEELFEDDLVDGCAEECAGEHLVGCLLRFLSAGADDYAFASGQAVGLNDYRGGEGGKFACRFFRGVADDIGCGGDLASLHELLGEGLAGFELGGGTGRAEDAEAVAFEFVDETESQWDFRADDGKIRTLG
jgi:hypothetical protein